MDTTALERLDSFPYRHRVDELMATPIVTIEPHRTLLEAAQSMRARNIGWLVVLAPDGRLAGIVTERDVLREVAAAAGGLDRPVSAAMNAPVHVIEADAPVYRALARMARLDIRHLPVVDERERPVGMLTQRALLRQRASEALTLGDTIACAPDAFALRTAHDLLPSLLRALRREDVNAAQASSVISGVTRDLSARAGELAFAAMAQAGLGHPPAPWCLLVLGSGGRGEALLAPDQDNALVHEGSAGDDAWFAAFGQQVNRLLDEAGVPLCKGGVMAGNAAYRHSLADWRTQIDSWIAHPQPEALLGVDIFFDFVGVLGERRLALSLREHAVNAARRSPPFLRLLAESAEHVAPATDLLGRLRTRDGRIDLKGYGLLPIVRAARAVAIAWGSTTTSTDARLTEAAAKGAISAELAQSLREARAVIVETILDQQLVDIAAGLPPGNAVEPTRLDRAANKRLRAALAAAEQAPVVVHDALSNRPIAPP